MQYKKQKKTAGIEQNALKANLLEFSIENHQSMLPFFHKNDLLLVESIPVDKIHRGDVLVFERSKHICAHRCIQKLKREGKISIITKGDNLSHVDFQPVEEKSIIGKVVGIKRKIRHINLESNVCRILSYFISLISFAHALAFQFIKNIVKNALMLEQWKQLKKIYFRIRWQKDLWIVKSLRKNYLPKFIIVGFPKCGTTALLDNLLKHPDIFGLEGEPRFFIRRYYLSLLKYVNQFDPSKVNGEKGSIYILIQEYMKRIYDVAPRTKIIICLREPIQATHSFYNHRKITKLFGHLYGEEEGKINFERLVLNDIRHELFSGNTYGYFKHIKNNVLKYFDKKQIYIVVQERMAKDTDNEMNKVFKFLGIRAHHDQWINFKNFDQFGKYASINYGSEGYLKAIDKLKCIYGPYNQQLFDFLGYEIEEWKVGGNKDNG